MSTLTPSQIDAARRALHHAAQERTDPSDLPSLIAAEQRHRCLLAARLSERDLAADERTAVVNGIAFADTKLIEYGVLAGRHRQAMKFPDYPAPHPSDDLGPRFAAARWVDQVDLYQTLTGQTAIKTSNGRHRLSCPWHNDRHPSLTIFGPGRGWWCFVCVIGGSPVDFVMRLRHCNAVEALLLIEEHADVAPHSFGGGGTVMTPDDAAAFAAREAAALLDEMRRKDEQDRLVIRSLADVVPRDIDWLWPKWLARGKLHLFAGHVGDGKGTMSAALAAIGSKEGRVWPDGTPAPRFRTLFVLGEDALDDTLRPRLDLHGADPSQIFALETVLDGEGRERYFNVARHLDLLEATIIEYAIDLVVIDPLTTIMAGSDRNAEGDTRDALTPLLKLGERLHVALHGIAHIGKPTGTSRTPVQRILGATAFGALARVVWLTAHDGDQMVLGVDKSNLNIKPPALSWSRAEDGPVIWHGVSARSIDDLLGPGSVELPRDRAEGFVRTLLSVGEQPATHVKAVAHAAGISGSTLRRATDAIKVVKRKSGVDGPWLWRLPGDDDGGDNGGQTDAPPKMLTP